MHRKHEGNPLAMYMSDLMTVQASVSGIPAISIPVAKDKDGMPIGMQLMSKALMKPNFRNFKTPIKRAELIYEEDSFRVLTSLFS